MKSSTQRMLRSLAGWLKTWGDMIAAKDFDSMGRDVLEHCGEERNGIVWLRAQCEALMYIRSIGSDLDRIERHTVAERMLAQKLEPLEAPSESPHTFRAVGQRVLGVHADQLPAKRSEWMLFPQGKAGMSDRTVRCVTMLFEFRGRGLSDRQILLQQAGVEPSKVKAVQKDIRQARKDGLTNLAQGKKLPEK